MAEKQSLWDRIKMKFASTPDVIYIKANEPDTALAAALKAASVKAEQMVTLEEKRKTARANLKRIRDAEERDREFLGTMPTKINVGDDTYARRLLKNKNRRIEPICSKIKADATDSARSIRG